MTPTERDRFRAWLSAVTAEEIGPDLPGRVRRRQEEILARPTRGKWVELDSELLGEIVVRLGGLMSASRHLGVVPRTLLRWAESGRVRPWAIVRFRELLAAGAPSLRRPNRGANRHYVKRETEK